MRCGSPKQVVSIDFKVSNPWKCGFIMLTAIFCNHMVSPLPQLINKRVNDMLGLSWELICVKKRWIEDEGMHVGVSISRINRLVEYQKSFFFSRKACSKVPLPLANSLVMTTDIERSSMVQCMQNLLENIHDNNLFQPLIWSYSEQQDIFPWR